jgi:hypothetical protein
MANRVERPNTVIKTNVTPINETVKQKVSLAISEIVNRIKTKHLS